jgi:hypothetical protein
LRVKLLCPAYRWRHHQIPGGQAERSGVTETSLLGQAGVVLIATLIFF